MILHIVGRYNGDESTLPQREHHPNAVPFKEFENIGLLSLISNLGCIFVIIILMIPFILLGREYFYDKRLWLMLGCVCSMLSLFPHEILHAIFYKKDVYFYTALNQGLFFVVGTEDMSKAKFIFMCLCPNIILGLLPYIIFLIFPHAIFFGIMGVICIGMGFGDYINVYNAVRQMPKGSKTYLSGFHSYWYLES